MEERKIVVIQTKNQKKSVIMSAATTLAELKSDLRANNIDYDNMTFFEGTSKIELKNDNSVLPHDIPYKGVITNELVFMLTNANKKIKSGAIAMSRSEAYNAIKSMGLQDACVKNFGKNFTMCRTADLIALIESNSNKAASEPVLAAPKAEEKVGDPANGDQCADVVARAAINKLVDILENNGTIEDYEKEEILNILGDTVDIPSISPEEHKPNLDSPYSNKEIDDMFAGIGI